MRLTLPGHVRVGESLEFECFVEQAENHQARNMYYESCRASDRRGADRRSYTAIKSTIYMSHARFCNTVREKFFKSLLIVLKFAVPYRDQPSEPTSRLSTFISGSPSFIFTSLFSIGRPHLYWRGDGADIGWPYECSGWTRPSGPGALIKISPSNISKIQSPPMECSL